jgi:hypothetical protein
MLVSRPTMALRHPGSFGCRFFAAAMAAVWPAPGCGPPAEYKPDHAHIRQAGGHEGPFTCCMRLHALRGRVGSSPSAGPRCRRVRPQASARAAHTQPTGPAASSSAGYGQSASYAARWRTSWFASGLDGVRVCCTAGRWLGLLSGLGACPRAVLQSCLFGGMQVGQQPVGRAAGGLHVGLSARRLAGSVGLCVASRTYAARELPLHPVLLPASLTLVLEHASLAAAMGKWGSGHCWRCGAAGWRP